MRRRAPGGRDPLLVGDANPPQRTEGDARVVVRHLGLIPYGEALACQRKLVRRLADDPDCPEHLLLLEHPPVFTIGRSSTRNNILVDSEVLRQEGIDVHFTNRGGDITYHGPGQLVAYPITRVNEHRGSVRGFLRALEEVVIRTLAAYNIRGERDSRYTGVWVGGSKMCAMGVAVNQWITWHGLALNVNTELRHFDLIVPCGIEGRTVTSMEKELGRPVDMAEVIDRLEHAYEEVLECRLVREESGSVA